MTPESANSNDDAQIRAKVLAAWTLHQKGELAQALAGYQDIIKRQPRHFDALHLAGVATAQMRQFDQAVGLIRAALEVDPTNMIAHFNMGNALLALKQFEAAIQSFDQTLRLNPTYAEAYNNRGNALVALKRPQEALASYDKAAALKLNFGEAYINRGNVLRDLGNPQAAVESYDKALQLNRKSAEIYNSRGQCLLALQQYQAALESFDDALHLKPDLIDALNSRGTALKELRRNDEALESYTKALQLKPDVVEIYFNRAILLDDLGQHAAAMEDFDRAVALDPHHAEANWARGLAYLQNGDFARGWPAYEWRWKTPRLKLVSRGIDRLWLGGESLQGKTILLHAEQGFGDTIQFSRYATLVADKGARVVLEVPRPLTSLLKTLPGVSEVVAGGDPLPDFDFYCPLPSLPLAFETRLATIPLAQGYLTPPPEKVAAWSRILGPKTKPRIGLTWSGSANQRVEPNRRIAFTEFVKRLPEGFEYVGLQKDVRPEDLAVLPTRPDIRQFSPQLEDFADTAALCSLMDRVVTVDTSIAHLAGALGKPVWVLLCFNPDWRWMVGRSDNPWYRSATLYRQERLGEWPIVLERVRADLIKTLGDLS